VSQAGAWLRYVCDRLVGQHGHSPDMLPRRSSPRPQEIGKLPHLPQQSTITGGQAVVSSLCLAAGEIEAIRQATDDLAENGRTRHNGDGGSLV